MSMDYFIDFLLFPSVFVFSGKNVELLEVSLKETLKVIRCQAMNAFIQQRALPSFACKLFNISKIPGGLAL